MLDIFDRIEKDSGGPIGQYFDQAFGYYMYPRLEGELCLLYTSDAADE